MTIKIMILTLSSQFKGLQNFQRDFHDRGLGIFECIRHKSDIDLGYAFGKLFFRDLLMLRALYY